jgi:hypothetical protein
MKSGTTFAQGALFTNKESLAARRADEPGIGLHRAVGRGDVLGTAGRAGEAADRVVGTWDDLDPVPVEGVDPNDVPAEEVAQAAIAALTGIVERKVRS